jgi:arylsulfatase A-like enzyme
MNVTRTTAALACLATLLVTVTAITAAEPKRPNILIAFADDWGRQASAYAQLDGPGTPNDLVRTPHFDRLAAEGVLFRTAFVSSPSCTPCRSALLTGQHFWRTGRGAILQGAIWEDHLPAFPLQLREAGYHIGKSYKVWSPGTPADAPYGGQAHAYESAGRRFNPGDASGDHGLPGFPYGKCNLYDFGSAVSLAIRWGGAQGGRVVDDLVSLVDLAPTLLEVAGGDGDKVRSSGFSRSRRRKEERKKRDRRLRGASLLRVDPVICHPVMVFRGGRLQ